MATEVQTAFFSYCREDSEFALKLAEDLKSAGAHVWIDQLDIEPGAPWDRAVEEALTNAPRMLVILSPVSVNSDNVRDEVSFALSRQKRVIPVLYMDCDVPFRLARLQHIDFRPDYSRGLRILLRALGVGGAAPPHPSAPEARVGQGGVIADDEASGRQAHAEELERERRLAEDQARLEEERLAAEKARVEREERERKAAEEIARQQKLEDERRAAAERDRREREAQLEEQRKAAAAAEQARIENERRAADEKARLEQQERERKEAEASARQEQSRREQRAAEQARLAEEARQAAENARRAQEEQARKEAEIKARQERLRREEQESSERASLNVAQIDRQQQPHAASVQPATKVAADLRPGGNVPAPARQPRELRVAARRSGSSAPYIWGAAVVLIAIGLATFFVLQHKPEPKPVAIQPPPAVDTRTSSSTSESAPVANALSNSAGSSASNSGVPLQGATGEDNSKEPASVKDQKGAETGSAPTQDGKKASSQQLPKRADLALKNSAVSSASGKGGAAGPTRVQLSADVSESFLMHEVVPTYPPLARQARVHGVVKLQVVIDKTGAVQNIRTLSGHPLLVPAAIDAVKQWRYRIFVVDGKPVEVNTLVTLNFELTN